MKKSLVVIGLLPLLMAGCAAQPDLEPDPVERALPTEQQLQRAMAQELDAVDIGGIAQVADALGNVTTASTSPDITAQTNFAYRSITKSFVGMVIAQLAEEGLIDLRDPISRYVDGVPDGDAITIADLATMRSGLPNYSAQPGFGAALNADPGVAPSTEDLLKMAWQQPNDFMPGEAFQYSNTNTLLLGEVIRFVTGHPWQVAVAQRILNPLRMSSVAYPDNQQMAEPYAPGFQQDQQIMEPLPLISFGWFGAAGGLTGNIADLTTWAYAMGSGDLVSPETQAQRLAVLAPTTDDPASPLYDNYGFAIGQLHDWIGHTGTGLGYQSLAMYDPDTGRTITILLDGTADDPDLPAKIFHRILVLL